MILMKKFYTGLLIDLLVLDYHVLSINLFI
jgi:hypothetical protein